MVIESMECGQSPQHTSPNDRVVGEQYLGELVNSVTPGTTCAPEPPLFTPFGLLSPSAGALVNGSITFVVKNTELNYVAKQMTYQMLNEEPDLQTASIHFTNFYNTANASTHPYRKMQAVQDDINGGNYSAAQTKLTAFVPANEIETNYKTYFTLAIKYASGTALSIAEQASLLAIAQKCPHTDGTCVYLARTMYQSIILNAGQSYYPFYDDCSANGGLYKNNPATIAPYAIFDVTLYPNPNNGTYYIACNTPTNEIVTIKVADMLGKTVIMQTSKCNMGIAYMQQSLPTGVYIASITSANGHKVSKPLIIK
jgi:hypothetical protein